MKSSSSNGNGARTSDERLPWLVMGQVAGDHRPTKLDVPKDLTADHVRQIREEAAATVVSNDASGVPSPTLLERIMESVEREAPSQGAGRTAKWTFSVTAWLQRFELTPAMGLAAAAAAVVIVVQTAVIGSMLLQSPSGTPATYQPASGETGATQDGVGYLVRFKSNATLDEVTSALRELGVKIVDGPRPGGFYRVALTRPETQARTAAEAALRNSTVISTVLPAGSQR